MQVVYPTILILETTAYCNAKCKFCAHSYMKRKKGIMKKELFHRIIDEISLWGEFGSGHHPPEIVPTMFGEFFLNPDWKYYLKYISDHLPLCPISLPTNGSCINDDAIDFIVKIPNIKYISFSVYAYSPELYHDLIGLPQETPDKISHAIERLRKERPDITVRVGATTDKEFVKNPVEEISLLVSKFGYIVEPHGITRNHAYHGYNHPVPEIESCSSVFGVMVVLHDGRVVPCCFDPDAEIVLGNATEDSLLDIWNGERSKTLREAHALGKRMTIPLCKSCSLNPSNSTGLEEV